MQKANIKYFEENHTAERFANKYLTCLEETEDFFFRKQIRF